MDTLGKSHRENPIRDWHISMSCGIGALASGFYFLEESITEKSVDRGDEIGGTRRFMFVASVEFYARGYLVLDMDFRIVSPILGIFDKFQVWSPSGMNVFLFPDA